MDVLYLLVPMSLVAMLAILAVFAWALHDAVGAQILEFSDAPSGAVIDADQPASGRAREESGAVDVNRRRSSP